MIFSNCLNLPGNGNADCSSICHHPGCALKMRCFCPLRATMAKSGSHISKSAILDLSPLLSGIHSPLMMKWL